MSLLVVVKEVQPKLAIGENVKGLLTHDGGRTLKQWWIFFRISGIRSLIDYFVLSILMCHKSVNDL